MSMEHIVTQTDMEILYQSSKELFTKLESLNTNNKIIDSIEGNVISDSLSISSDSSGRRSYSSTFQITDSTFDLSRDKRFWFDKYVRCYIGVKHTRSKEIVWYLLGTFITNSTSTTFDAETNILNISFNDKMCLLSSEYGGQVSSYKLVIESGEDARITIIGLLNEAGIKDYRVGEINEEIPYDLEFESGTGYHDVFSKICELFAGWEFYFDINGVFIWDLIPSCNEDPVILDSETMWELLISENTQNSIGGVYNKTVVFGGEIETDFFSEQVTHSSGTYSASVEMMSSYENGDTLSLMIPCRNETAVSYINVNGLGRVPICDDSGDNIEVNTFNPSTCYSFRYRKLNPKKVADFYLLGQYQPYGEYTETDNICEFSVDNVGRELVQTLIFEEIYSDDLARQRAEYETYIACRLKDTITLEMMPVYWINVNQKVEYQKSGSDKTVQYIIKDVSLSSMETMTITMSKFYEDYSVVYNKKYRLT